jgi:hypothetical protein
MHPRESVPMTRLENCSGGIPSYEGSNPPSPPDRCDSWPRLPSREAGAACVGGVAVTPDMAIDGVGVRLHAPRREVARH